ncbi:MAG: GGDEF domain-containing protein [Pseudomonas fluorescens]|nr:MAG: GGDEF domain-containing protein [Pseudomonas fluorescens]
MNEAQHNDLISEFTRQTPLDLRLVMALAGERDLNARELQIVDKLKGERGEGLFADMLYALTRKSFPSRQAKLLWGEIGDHRKKLQGILNRDPGVALAAHDYLVNVSGLLKTAGLIEEQKFQALATVASRDGLTGLYDKTTFARLMEEELSRQARFGRPVTLVLIDIDHFKQLNDTHGHADGDVVLAQVAELIAAQARSTDSCGRFGGEEFGVILPEVDTHAGAVLAERVRAAVERAFAHTPYSVTVSLGVATGSSGVKADDLVRAADAALYEAKRGGRNCVRVAKEIVTTV